MRSSTEDQAIVTAMRFPLGLAAAAAAVLLLAPAAGTLAEAKSRLDLLRLAGLRAVRVTSIWDPAAPHPSASELAALNNLAAAAKLDAIDLFVSVYNFGTRTTPLSDDQQTSFADYAAELARGVPDLQNFIIGNEPNLNRFWMPQFNLDGSDAAAPAYLSLLYRTYTGVLLPAGDGDLLLPA
jgi:hypothetical protein